MAARPALTEPELEAIWAGEIEPWLFGGARSDAPVLLMMGAQPGAGKSHGIGVAEALHPGVRFTRIIGDDLRPFHPDYVDLLESPDPEAMPAATAEASGWWVRRSLAHAAQGRFPTVVEGTFRDRNVPLGTAAPTPERNPDLRLSIRTTPSIVKNPQTGRASSWPMRTCSARRARQVDGGGRLTEPSAPLPQSLAK
jgi:hypothetical protein